MCGLVGVITKNQNGFSKDLCDAFDSLLYVDALRGMDSTGVFLVERNGEVAIAKEASAAHDYRQAPEYKALLNGAFQRGRALVGHNRAATKGVVIDANAHPFVVDDRITLCHNGTLWGDFKKMAGKDVDVDSHAIAHVIHESGDDVEKAIQQVNGAFALIWHDFKNNTLNFLRNEQRPLHFVEVSNGWLWASEPSMLLFAVARHNLKMEGDISGLKAGTLTTYDFSNSSWKVDTKDIVLEAPKSYTSYTSASAQGNWKGSQSRHPYANGYFGYDEDDYSAPARPACEIPPHQPKKTLAISVDRGAYAAHTLQEEHRIAKAAGINYPSPAFMQHSEGGKIKDKEFYVGTCLDYIEICKGKPEHGYWLYAQLDKDPNFIIKVPVSNVEDETVLLDLGLNNRKVLFYVTTRAWRAYTNAADGAGYGMLHANSYRLVDEQDDTTNEVTGTLYAG